MAYARICRLAVGMLVSLGLIGSIPAQAKVPGEVDRGRTIILNGKTIDVAWLRWREGSRLRVGIADMGLREWFGVRLFDNSSLQSQPVNWTGNPNAPSLNLVARFDGKYRYLDVTDRLTSFQWQPQISNGKLTIALPPSKVVAISPSQATDRQQISVKIDRFVPWRLSQSPTEGFLTIQAAAISRLISPPTPTTTPSTPSSPTDPGDDITQTNTRFRVSSNGKETVIQFPIPVGSRAIAQSVGTKEIRLDIAPDARLPVKIQWAPSIVWRHEWTIVNNKRFPIDAIEIDPTSTAQLRPIVAGSSTLTGIEPLIKLAAREEAAIAINGGYFNRIRQFPLGALALRGNWLSSPILNRGTIAWRNWREYSFLRPQWQETVRFDNSAPQAVYGLNSGYPQAGIARYTSQWNSNYIPLQANETIAIVGGGKITNVLSNLQPTSPPIPVTRNEYLLVWRGSPTTVPQIGANVNVIPKLLPPGNDRFSHFMGAGPMLIQRRQIVLDAASEGFSASFATGEADRSAIAIAPNGKWWLVTAGMRVGGKGPTLTEWAQILRQMGATEALNLDGGSSTSLYLGGHLVNRSPATAARVHNAIGIFF